jgi:hypothetical protein
MEFALQIEELGGAARNEGLDNSGVIFGLGVTRQRFCIFQYHFGRERRLLFAMKRASPRSGAASLELMALRDFTVYFAHPRIAVKVEWDRLRIRRRSIRRA